MSARWFLGTASLAFFIFAATRGVAQDEQPRSTDPRLKIELYAESPQIVTPTGIDVDHAGRVWAIESNTHFPPEGYQGHPTDRILVMQGRDNAGRAERITVFKDGLTHSMSIAVKPVWLGLIDAARKSGNEKPETNATEVATPKKPRIEVFIATRREILLCTDNDGDLKCDDVKQLVHLETTGNYPHNGLAGLAFDAMGNLFFGFGENLGADYKIIGSDGVTLSGGGEGGNVYRCRPDGSKLERWATGFWNPHASCFDAFGHLFTLDNDPDSRPPCRLLHIIPGGDYGYRFRNGRKGTHPFTAWNGEIPGTLPMVSGTGEAPSGIVCYESDGFPEDYLGTLLVGSWGDHRIDKLVLKPRGVSFESIPQPLIKGGENFRPVGLAIAPDGSLFVTDWVSKEYKLHGLGRIWRVSAKDEPTREVIDVAAIGVPESKEKLYSLLKSKRMDIRRTVAKQAEIIGNKRDWCVEIKHNERRLKKPPNEDLRITSELLLEPYQFEPGDRNWAKMPVDERWMIAWALPLSWSRNEEVDRLDPNDPFVFAIRTGYLAIGKTPEDWILRQLEIKRETNRDAPPNGLAELSKPLVELMLGLAGRRNLPKSLAIPRKLLASIEPPTQRLAVQWVGEEYLKELRPDVERVLASEPMTNDLFLACLASLSLLDGVPPSEFEKNPPAQYITAIVADANRPASLRAMALRMLSPLQKELDAKLLGELLASPDAGLRREVVRTLQHSPIPERETFLQKIAADPTVDLNDRADAVAGLARINHHEKPSNATTDLLINLASNREDLLLRLESIRSLRGSSTTNQNQQDGDGRVTTVLKQLASTSVNGPDSDRVVLSEALAFARGIRPARSTEEILVDITRTEADGKSSTIDNATSHHNAVESGRRAFFHANSAGCYKCHMVGGRGGQVGPDLTVIARTMDRKKLAESILNPNKEISPQFTTWAIETTSGKVLTGMLLGEEVNGDLRLGNAQGEIFFVPFKEIETRTPLKTSIMPEKLHESMTTAEFRDLIAFLESLK